MTNTQFERQLAQWLHSTPSATPSTRLLAAATAHARTHPRRDWRSLLAGAGTLLRPMPVAVRPIILLALLTLTFALGAFFYAAWQSNVVVPQPTPTIQPQPRNHGITLVSPRAPDYWGLSQVVNGSDGDVWFLEAWGLARLDAASGRVQTWDAGDDLAFDAQGLAAARDGGVWLLNWQNSIRHFDGQSLGDPLRLPGEAKGVVAVAEGVDGTLWAATEGGLFRGDHGTWSIVPGQQSGVSTTSISLDSNGNVWVVELAYPGPSFVGIGRYDGRGWTTITEGDADVPLSTAASVTADGSGGIWVGGYPGLAHFDGSNWTAFTTRDLGAAGSWSVTIGPAGHVWAVPSYTTGPMGVARYEDGKWTRWGPEAGLPAAGTSVTAAIVDVPSGPILTMAGAAYRLDGDRWQLVWQLPAGALGDIRGVVPAVGLEAWWLSGETVVHYSPTGREILDLPDGAAEVHGIAVAADGTPWLATDAGVATASDGRWSIIDPHPAVGLTIAPDGTVWAMGANSALRTIRAGSSGWRLSDVAGSSATQVQARYGIGPALVVDGAGQLWANGGYWGYSHAPGLRRFDGQRWQPMLPDGAASGTVFGNVAVAPDGTLWVTLDGEGSARFCCTEGDPAAQVARYHGDRWTVFGVANGLPVDTTEHSLAITPDGTVWLSTVDGIYRLEGEIWQLAIGDHFFGPIAAAPDGALWTTDGEVLRIGDPLH